MKSEGRTMGEEVGSKGTLPLDNTSENSMQNSFFNKNADNSPNVRSIHKASPLLSALDEDEFSNNILNIGFIAEDSKLHFSDSSSVVSEGMSISAVSAIHANPKGSPHYISAVPEEFGTISGMEEWSSPEAPFPKRNFKRCKPEMIEDELEQLANRCTKKKMGDRNKILTINAGSKGFQKSYMTRSRGKLVGEEDSSSNDDIREMLRDIDRGQNDPSKAKLKTCPK